MSDLIEVHNDGPRIARTNYFDTPAALLGHVYLSVNAGAFRLLVPSASAGWHAEMQGAEYAILTRGMWTPPPQPQEDGTRRIQHPREGLELLWEDHTDSPFSIHLGAAEVDRLPARQDEGRTDLRLLVYAEGIELVQEIPARYRRASKLPYLKPWSSR